MNSKYRVILADDHVMLREGLKRILSERTDLEVIGEAGDGIELLSLLKNMIPHMVILDISMPKLRGIEAIHEIKGIYPNIKILVLTMHDDEDYLCQTISAGADGYLLKKDADKELFSAIDKLKLGRIYVSPHIANNLTGGLEGICDATNPSLESNQLTVREREIVKLVAEGRSSKEIADFLFISIRTVDNHRANIMQKLKLKKTVELVRYAINKGYI